MTSEARLNITLQLRINPSKQEDRREGKIGFCWMWSISKGI
jgi:hypothetical protein